MDAAEKHNKRYRAVIAKAQGAFLKLSALEAWAAAHELPVSFFQAFPFDGEGEAPPPERHYIDYSLIGYRIGEIFKEKANDFAVAAYAERLGASEADRKTAAVTMNLEIDNRILCAVFDGELKLYDAAGMPIDVTGERKQYEVFPEAYMSLDYRLSKTPAPLMAGNSMTRLDKWLGLETWTPWEGALLVTGTDPGTYREATQGKSLPHATGLCGGSKFGEHDFLDAKAVLDKWNRQMDPPAKVAPASFVKWCVANGIDADWLRNVPAAPEATTLDSDVQPATKPLSRQRHQENEVLRIIRELGHDPLKLPPQSQGKRWVAADVRDKLTGPGWTKSIHDKTWQRLRDNGDIKEG